MGLGWFLAFRQPHGMDNGYLKLNEPATLLVEDEGERSFCAGFKSFPCFKNASYHIFDHNLSKQPWP